MFVLPFWFFQTQRKIPILQSELSPSELAISFLLPIFSVVPGVWTVFGFIFSTRNLSKTYVYDDGYVQLPMTSFLHQKYHPVRQYILGPQGAIISFPHNFTKNTFSKVRLVSEISRSDLCKEPIKNQYLCKNVFELIGSVTTGTTCQVNYNDFSNIGMFYILIW